ncbi:MAG: hypothetical protein FJY56_02820 [Betaproteobacteria bacterium]|nr:hypothetical protein [Betaproteobacteria bacterium]
MAAAARGEAPRDAEVFNCRAEEIGGDITKRGAILVKALLSVFETAARRAVREGLSDSASQAALFAR